MKFLDQHLSCIDERKEHGYSQKKTQADQGIQYTRALQLVALCLTTNTQALEHIRHNGLYEDDLNALRWMQTSLDDMLATIHGLLQAHDHRYPQ
ncbi:hypothetical protein H4V95_001720 [Arthrobacter sp. CAN_C5]|nr:hypothetical protein [Arthrobacter sp. CAN_C5]